VFVFEKFLTTDSDIKPKTNIKVNLRLVLQPENFPSIVNKLQKFGIDAEKRFRSGDKCIVATVNGEIVHWTWVAFKEAYVGVLEKKIRVPDTNSAYVYGIYTLRKYRRLGIASKAMEALLNHLHSRGIKRVFVLIHHNNFPSIRYHQKIGFKKIGTIKFIKILKLKLYSCIGETKEDYNFISGMLFIKDHSKFQFINGRLLK